VVVPIECARPTGPRVVLKFDPTPACGAWSEDGLKRRAGRLKTHGVGTYTWPKLGSRTLQLTRHRAFVPVAGRHAAVGCEDAEPAVAKMLSANARRRNRARSPPGQPRVASRPRGLRLSQRALHSAALARLATARPRYAGTCTVRRWQHEALRHAPSARAVVLAKTRDPADVCRRTRVSCSRLALVQLTKAVPGRST
jgi:hypothetical protein